MKFHNPNLSSVFDKFDGICQGLYTDYAQMTQDILAIESYMENKPVPLWTCDETGIAIGIWGDRKRIMFFNPKAQEFRPLQDAPLHVRIKAVPTLPRFIENLTKELKNG